jgi:hypothetical protein
MVMTLYDLATVIRSKNAGPFVLTVDLIFDSPSALERALSAPGMAVERIAARYGVDAACVGIHTLRPACAVKITLPRRVSSGSAGDTDVYGSQQHMPVAGIRV